MSPDAEIAQRVAAEAARASYGKLVAILASRDRDIAAAEDALSEALVAALAVWPERGIPQNPEGWLLTVARNRRKNAARADMVHRLAMPEIERRVWRAIGEVPVPDERLTLMFVCAHPAIDAAVRTPLILQTVLGIESARIARLFLTEPAAMAQRLVRAKARIRDSGLRFALPEPEDMPQRLAAVLEAIYATFSEGWDRWDQPEAADALTGEAIWLARLIVSLMPDEPEPQGLLALMLYCTARRHARRDTDGRFVPLDQQQASLWDRTMIIEAENLLISAARHGRFGRFQCEAAIQSVHSQRPFTGVVNWAALRLLYDLLVTHSDSVGARIGRAVVMAEAGDAVAGLAALEALDPNRVARHQPYWVARSRIATLAARPSEAMACLQTALDLTDDLSVRQFLERQLSALRQQALEE